MKEYCEGKNCSKKDTCVKHMGSINNEYNVVDYSTKNEGSVFRKVFICGNNSILYSKYEEYESVNKFLYRITNEWKIASGIDNEDCIFTFNKGTFTIYTNHMDKLKGYNDELLKKYVKIIASKLNNFEDIQFQYLYKPYVVFYNLKQGIINIEDTAFVFAEDENDAQVKLEETIRSKTKDDFTIRIIYAKEIKTEVYSKTLGLL